MKKAKLILTGVLFVTLAGGVFAQSRNETTVEDEYLSSVEDVIITELSSSPEYDNKIIALQYLENALGEGRSTPDMIRALTGLAGEGVTTKARTNGRLMNNYPDIRRKVSLRYLRKEFHYLLDYCDKSGREMHDGPCRYKQGKEHDKKVSEYRSSHHFAYAFSGSGSPYHAKAGKTVP